MSRDHRYQSLLDQLRRQIDSAFAPGERLPSKRELAAMHGVAARTVERALKALETEGCVRVIPRVGSVRAGVAPRPPNLRRGRGKLTVAIMTRRWTGGWPAIPIYPALLDEARRRGIEALVFANRHRVRPTARRCRIELAKIPWNTFDLGLLVEAEDTIAARDPLLFKRRVLAVDQDASHQGFDSVAFADAQAGALAARHLLELGHTRFAVTEEISDPGLAFDPCWTVRRHGFELAIGEAGAALLPQWRLPLLRRGFTQGAGHNLQATVAAWAAAPRAQRPTALFMLAGGYLGELLAELARHGLRVPRDLSIVTTAWIRGAGGGEQPLENGLRLTSIDFDLTVLARRTFDAALKLAAQPPRTPPTPRRSPQIFLAPVSLTPGESTAPPPK